jgi:hypothetical protein
VGFFYVTLQIFKVYVGVPPRKASGQAIRSNSALAKPRLRGFHFYPSREQPTDVVAAKTLLLILGGAALEVVRLFCICHPNQTAWKGVGVVSTFFTTSLIINTKTPQDPFPWKGVLRGLLICIKIKIHVIARLDDRSDGRGHADSYRHP